MRNSSFSLCCNDISISTQCSINVELGKLQLMAIAKEGWWWITPKISLDML